MAQARVRDLPDVDRSGKDVFETPDRPDFVAGVVKDERAPDAAATENIDSSGVQSKEALKVFAALDGAEGSGSRRRGFKTQSEFSAGGANGERFLESPLERLQRLKSETKQFLDDVETLAKESKAPVEQGVSAQELATELKTMLAQLDAQLQNEKLQHILLPGVVSREERDQSKLTQQLAVAVQAAKTSSPVAPVAAPPAAASAPLTTTGGTLTRAEYAALDARLAALENALGSGATPGPLLPMLRQVQNKLALLDTATLDSLASKAKSVNNELASAASKSESPAQLQKVEELHEIASRWDATASSLPAIVTRLKSLRALHTEASTVATLLRSIEGEQTSIKALLQGNDAALAKLSENFAKNAAVIEANVSQLDKRMAELNARVEKLSKQ